MSTYWFPDNTVLCNFAAVGRCDLLEEVLAGRGRWVEAVAHEAGLSARVLTDLHKVLRGGWMGEPIQVSDPDEIRKIELARRQVFGGTADHPRRHLGEAQTCHVLLNRPGYGGAWWITDDREAYEYAKGRGLVVRQTVDLFREAVAGGLIQRHEAWLTLQQIRERGHHLVIPRSPDLL